MLALVATLVAGDGAARGQDGRPFSINATDAAASDPEWLHRRSTVPSEPSPFSTASLNSTMSGASLRPIGWRSTRKTGSAMS